MNEPKIKSFAQAMERLEKEASRAGTAIRKGNWKNMPPEIEKKVREFKDKSLQQLDEARDYVTKTSRETAQRVDREAHQNPWLFVAIAAFASAVLGFILGRKSKD